MRHIEMKQAVTNALEENNYDAIMTLALADRKVLSVLVRLAYHKDTILGWRAITAIGRISTVFVRSNADYLRETIRKLLWSLTDESGGIGWSAPEILGEIVSADPAGMADVIPLIAEVFKVEERVFRPGVLYALKRIAQNHPEAVEDFQDLILKGMSDENPLTRAYALQLILELQGRIKLRDQGAVHEGIQQLIYDVSEVCIYHRNGFLKTYIGDLAEEANSEFKNYLASGL